MLYFNGYIFNTNNLLPLKDVLKRIYSKKIELNIINLKYLYLDSNIFAEAITRKLKDRNKRVLRVLKLHQLYYYRACAAAAIADACCAILSAILLQHAYQRHQYTRSA